MGVVRQYVFPTARIVIWAVIAAALVALALKGADLDPPDALQPTGEITEPVLTVEKGSVTNAVTVPGAVVTDPPVEIRATADGVVAEIEVDDARADKDVRVLWIKSEARRPRRPGGRRDRRGDRHRAGAEGHLDLGARAGLRHGRRHRAPGPGRQRGRGRRHRLPRHPRRHRHPDRRPAVPARRRHGLGTGDAQGRARAVRVHRPHDRRGPGAGGEEATGESATGAVRCAVPRKIKAFAGLGAEIEITNGSAKDVVVVPISAVLGTSQTGRVWVVPEEGAEPEPRDVSLGLTDGLQVEVTQGLEAGEQILEFTPVEDGTEGGVDCEDTTAYDEAAAVGDTTTMQAFEEECFG
ncbi:secretion protein HlyD [Promicromonospora citrea]|uniref:secretion protein HlyD n=1 Tax=Promicromonospora citrea TaxID=43677 RepID=UPI0036177C88